VGAKGGKLEVGGLGELVDLLIQAARFAVLAVP
jgi:hypothetical protein